MRAAAYERYGPPEVVAVAERPVPEPGAGGGTYLTTVPSFAIMLQQLTSRAGSRRAVIMFTGPRKDADKVPDLEELAALAASGELRPPIEREVTLEDVAEGHRLVDTGHKSGSVVVRPGTADSGKAAAS